MRPRLIVALFAAAAVAAPASAAGPMQVARAAPSLWPHPIDSPAAFDHASRAEILALIAAFGERSVTTLPPRELGLRNLDQESLHRWVARAEHLWIQAFRSAAKSCKGASEPGCQLGADNFPALLTTARAFLDQLPAAYQPWRDATRTFDLLYIREQLRLAALFPNPTSEVLPLSDHELLGDELPDRTFTLTFDDGPTPVGGETDRLLNALNSHRIEATFFALGSALEKRIASTDLASVSALYRGQCLASHGYQHVAHSRAKDWERSLDRTDALIARIVPGQARVDFRPPYGQRHPALVDRMTAKRARVVLWNIDSQDWHSSISAAEVGDRVMKLMLQTRRGIVLFHDTRAKASLAAPRIAAFAEAAGLTWGRCLAQ